MLTLKDKVQTTKGKVRYVAEKSGKGKVHIAHHEDGGFVELLCTSKVGVCMAWLNLIFVDGPATCPHCKKAAKKLPEGIL